MNLFRLFSLAALALLPFAQADAYETELKSLSQMLADKIAASGKTQVAVVGFLDSSRKMTQLGQFLADEIAVNLADSGKGFKVISRSRLDTLIKEQKIVYSGLVDDPKVASQLGKVAGVEALITATLTQMSDAVRLQLQIINAETAAIEGGVNGNIQLTKQIEELLKKAVVQQDSILSSSESNTVDQSENTPDRKPVASDKNSYTELSLMFCKADKQLVTCEMSIKSISDDYNLKLSVAQVVDESGTEYENSIKYKDGRTERTIPVDIGVPIILTFDNVSTNVNLLGYIKVEASNFGLGTLTYKLRHIPITR